MTDAQEGLRAAQEYINRDLVIAGDGLRGITQVRVPSGFVTNYLTLAPVTDATDPGFIKLTILTSDDNIPAGTNVLPTTSPATTVRSNPTLTDRMTLMTMDRTFTAISLAATAVVINSTNATVSVSSSDVNKFRIGVSFAFLAIVLVRAIFFCSWMMP